MEQELEQRERSYGSWAFRVFGASRARSRLRQRTGRSSAGRSAGYCVGRDRASGRAAVGWVGWAGGTGS